MVEVDVFGKIVVGEDCAGDAGVGYSEEEDFGTEGGD